MRTGVLGAAKMASELSKRAKALGWLKFFDRVYYIFTKQLGRFVIICL